MGRPFGGGLLLCVRPKNPDPLVPVGRNTASYRISVEFRLDQRRWRAQYKDGVLIAQGLIYSEDVGNRSA
jgi:hypothetical protein